MASDDGGGESVEEIPGESVVEHITRLVKTTYGRYVEFKEYLSDYVPYFTRTTEIIMAIILFFGFFYWLYLFFIVGT